MNQGNNMSSSDEASASRSSNAQQNSGGQMNQMNQIGAASGSISNSVAAATQKRNPPGRTQFKANFYTQALKNQLLQTL